MSIFLTLECTAGSEIGRVSADAQRIADMIGISVDFTFNDVRCVAAPGGSAEHLASQQQEQQSRKLERPFDRRFATSRIFERVTK